MALSPIDALCEHCGTKFTAQPKRSFLAFQKLTCPACDHVTTYPLTTGYRNIYWGLVALTIMVFFVRLIQGELKPPGWLGLLAIFVLFRDGKIRNNTGSALKNYSLLPGVFAILLTLMVVGFFATTFSSVYPLYLDRAKPVQATETSGGELDGRISKKSGESNLSKAANDIGAAGSSVTNLDGDPSWLNTYLAIKVPTSAVRELARQKQEKGEFQIFPSRVTYQGSIKRDGKEYPAYATIQTKKKCAWRVDLDMTIFMEMEGSMVRMNTMMAIDEKFDAMAAYEQTYIEAAVVSSYDDSDGKLFEQSIEKYSVEKTKNGVQVDFKEPDVRSAIGYGDILLTAESDQFILDMMRRGTSSYSYMLLDADSPQLYSKEDVVVTEYPDSDKFDGVRLWHLMTESHDLVEAEWQRTMTTTEIWDSNGIALYFGFNDPDIGEAAFYLQEVEFTQPERCVEDANPQKSASTAMATLSLPDTVAGFHLGEAISNEEEDPGLGVTLPYSRRGAKATVYVYNLELSDIPDGPESAIALQHFADILRDIQSLSGGDVYQDVEIVNENLTECSTRGKEFLCAQLKLTQNDETFSSYLYLSAFNGNFVKIRVSAAPDMDVKQLAVDFSDEIAKFMWPEGIKIN